MVSIIKSIPRYPLLNIWSGERNTEGDVANTSSAVIAVQVQGVSSVKVEYDGTASCNT
jgi:hypothetical protein